MAQGEFSLEDFAAAPRVGESFKGGAKYDGH